MYLKRRNKNIKRFFRTKKILTIKPILALEISIVKKGNFFKRKNKKDNIFLILLKI